MLKQKGVQEQEERDSTAGSEDERIRKSTGVCDEKRGVRWSGEREVSGEPLVEEEEEEGGGGGGVVLVVCTTSQCTS